jgi:hypothetical protein
MQHRSTVTPSEQAEALKRDALILAILRTGPGDNGGGMIKLQDLAAMFGQWRKLNSEARALFLRNARANGTFAELDGRAR